VANARARERGRRGEDTAWGMRSRVGGLTRLSCTGPAWLPRQAPGAGWAVRLDGLTGALGSVASPRGARVPRALTSTSHPCCIGDPGWTIASPLTVCLARPARLRAPRLNWPIPDVITGITGSSTLDPWSQPEDTQGLPETTARNSHTCMRVRGPPRVMTGGAATCSFWKPAPLRTSQSLAGEPAGGEHAPPPPSPLNCPGSAVSSGERTGGRHFGRPRAKGSEDREGKLALGRSAPSSHCGFPTCLGPGERLRRRTRVLLELLHYRPMISRSDTLMLPPVCAPACARPWPLRRAWPQLFRDARAPASALARSVRMRSALGGPEQPGRVGWRARLADDSRCLGQRGRRAPAWPATPDVRAGVAEGQLPIPLDLTARRHEDDLCAHARGRARGAGARRS